jgi:hypothetical protein
MKVKMSETSMRVLLYYGGALSLAVAFRLLLGGDAVGWACGLLGLAMVVDAVV